MEKKLSIISHKKAKSLVEKTAAMIFRGCAIISVLAVVTITGYMIISGTPAHSSQSSIWDCLCYINIHCWGFSSNLYRSTYWFIYSNQPC